MELFKLFGSIFVDNDEANKSISKTDDKAKKTSGTFSKMIGTVGKWGLAIGAATGTAAIAVGAFAFKTANELDDATKKIRAGAGATGEALKDLRKDFDVVFSQVPQDADAVATAIADLNTKTGQTGESLQKLSKAELQLAKLTGGDLAQQITNTTRLFGDWGIEGENQVATLDKLWNVSQTTGIGVDDLAQKMVQFGAPLRQMGFDFDTSSALMGKWEKEGVNAELVLSSLRIALGRMAKEGVTDTNQALTEMIEKIKSAGSTGEANLLAMEQFGAKAGPDMAAAIREGKFELDDLLSTLKDSPETIQRATDNTLKFGDKFTLLKNRIMLAIEPLGNKLLPLVEKFADFLVEKMPIVEETIGKVLGFISEKFNLLSGVIEEKASPVFKILTEKVIPPLVELFKKVQTTYIPAFMRVIQEAFPIIQTIISDVITAIVEYIMPPLITIFEFIYTDVMPKVLAIFEKVLPTIEKLWEALWTVLEPLLWLLKKTFDLIFPEIKEIVLEVLNEIEFAIDIFLKVIDYVLDSIINFKDNWNIVWKELGDYIIEIWDNVKSNISDAISWITDKINAVLKTIKAVTDAAKNIGSGVLNKAKSFIGIETRATGGTVNAKQPYLVGEKGMELFVPNTNGNIVPNHNLQPNNKTSTINVNISGNTIMNDKDADKFGNLIVNRLKILGVN